jgi:hypothetical protein
VKAKLSDSNLPKPRITYKVTKKGLILEKRGTYIILTPEEVQEVKDIFWALDVKRLAEKKDVFDYN